MRTRFGIKGRVIVDLKEKREFPILGWKRDEYITVFKVAGRPNDEKIHYRHPWFYNFPHWGRGVM